jgi:hypothetical protein
MAGSPGATGSTHRGMQVQATVPAELTFHFCIPLGYPAEGARFGGSRRRPIRETTYLDHWGAPVPWT